MLALIAIAAFDLVLVCFRSPVVRCRGALQCPTSRRDGSRHVAVRDALRRHGVGEVRRCGSGPCGECQSPLAELTDPRAQLR